jgi:hypothetical protein
MRPLGHGGGAAGWNSAASPAVSAGEEAGEVLGFVRDPLVGGFGAERPLVSDAVETGRRWPRAALLRRPCGALQATCGRGSLVGPSEAA